MPRYKVFAREETDTAYIVEADTPEAAADAARHRRPDAMTNLELLRAALSVNSTYCTCRWCRDHDQRGPNAEWLARHPPKCGRWSLNPRTAAHWFRMQLVNPEDYAASGFPTLDQYLEALGFKDATVRPDFYAFQYVEDGLLISEMLPVWPQTCHHR